MDGSRASRNLTVQRQVKKVKAFPQNIYPVSAYQGTADDKCGIQEPISTEVKPSHEQRVNTAPYSVLLVFEGQDGGLFMSQKKLEK